MVSVHNDFTQEWPVFVVLAPFFAIVDGLGSILRIPANPCPQNRIPSWNIGGKSSYRWYFKHSNLVVERLKLVTMKICVTFEFVLGRDWLYSFEDRPWV